MGMETLWCYVGHHLAAPEGVCGVGGLLCSWRRICGYSLGSEHISALGKTLNVGVETLWCYAGQHLAAAEGVCGVGRRRVLGVGVAL